MAKKPNKQPVPQPAPAKQAPQARQEAAKPAPSSEPKGVNLFSVKMLCLILGVISFLLYANTLMNGYVMDDVIVLKENTIVQQGFKGIPELLVTPHMRGYLVIPNDLYRPLSLVLFAAEYPFFGASPTGYHFMNVLIFAGCVIMLFLFLDKLFGGKKTAVAFVASLIFAVHPIHTEVVANIKSCDELLCFFFGFLSLNIFVNYMKSGKMLQLILGVFVLFLAFISKETVIAFLGIIPLVFFFYINDDKKRAVYITAGSAVVFAIFMIIRSHILTEYNANQPAGVEFIDNALSKAPNMVAKITTEAVVLGMYLKLMFIPHPLLCTYSFNAIPYADLADWRFWLSLLAYLGMIYVAVTRFIKNKKDPWAFCIIFYLATLFLFSNIPFLMGAELAERFAFFASVGFCLAAALAVEQWLLKGEAVNIMSLKSTKVLAVLIPVSLIFGGLTVARNANWKDNITLYRADVANSPNDCRLYHNVASSLAEDVYPTISDTIKKKEMDNESLNYLRHALTIYPEYADVHVEMGRIYDRKRRYDSAEYHDALALQLNPINFTATNNLGSVYLTSGKYPQAIAMFKKALELNPNFKFPYINLARTYVQLKQYDSAVMNYHKMLGFEPNSIEGLQGMGIAFFQGQRYDSAEYYFNQVLQRTPDEPTTVNYLSATYFNSKNYPKAIALYKKVIATSPNDLNAWSNIGRAYFYSGQYQLAIDAFNKEIQIDPKVGPKDLPGIALSYQKMGNMEMARKYEAYAKQVDPKFTLPK